MMTVPSGPEERAADRAEAHLRTAASQLDPPVTLQLESATVAACDDPTDGGPLGRVFVTRRYWLVGADPTPPGSFDRLADYWLRHGYRIRRDRRAAAYPHLWVEHRQDGYRVGLDRNATGELLLGASSPCFWPSRPR